MLHKPLIFQLNVLGRNPFFMVLNRYGPQDHPPKLRPTSLPELPRLNTQKCYHLFFNVVGYHNLPHFAINNSTHWCHFIKRPAASSRLSQHNCAEANPHSANTTSALRFTQNGSKRFWVRVLENHPCGAESVKCPQLGVVSFNLLCNTGGRTRGVWNCPCLNSRFFPFPRLHRGFRAARQSPWGQLYFHPPAPGFRR